MGDAILQPLQQLYFTKALLGGALVATVCGVVGCFVVLRRMAFLGDALSHAMLAGVTAGYLIMQMLFGSEAHAPAMLLGALIAGLLTVGLIGFVSSVSRVKEDTAIGIMYTGIFATGGLLASAFSHRIHVDINHFLLGFILGISDEELWMMSGVCVTVLTVVILFFRHFQITSFDPVMAASLGIPVLAFDYLLTGCTSLVVVSAVPLVGVVLVVGLLITPAATAYLICDRLSKMMLTSAAFGISSVVSGLFLAEWLKNLLPVAPAPMIVVMGTFQFMVVLFVAPRYGIISGWLRRMRHVPQQLTEDILRCFGQNLDDPLSSSRVLQQIQKPADQIQRAIQLLERQEWLSERGGMLALTEEGRHHTRRLLRAHRLWETYLHHMGTPPEQLHSRAHELEHIHDEATVDYLDDKLGHPLRDPHGAEIPEDFVHLVPGARAKASLLREGHRAVIREILPRAKTVPLALNAVVQAGPRTNDGKTWNFQTVDGQVIQLDHATADHLVVELLTE